MFSIFTGLIGGIMHVYTGPDHLSAIMPLSAKVKNAAWLIGLRWGLGHTGGVFLIGFLALLFRESIPVHLISSYSERIVGVVLIYIGIWGLQKIAFACPAEKGKNVSTGNKAPNRSVTPYKTAFFVGIIHGLAGSSHFIGVLPALVMTKRSDAALYLISFGFGTVAAMTSFSGIIGHISYKLSLSGKNIYNGLLYAFSLTSIAVGGIWLFI